MTESTGKVDLPDIDAFYAKYRQDFFAYAKKHAVSTEDIQDIYQDAVIALYENVQEGRLKEMTSSLKTYLFSIGKYLMLNKIRKAKRLQSLDDQELMDVTREMEETQVELSDKQVVMLDMLKELSEGCQEILHLYFYRRFSIEAIVHHLGYKNENTVKAHKSRCQKKLRELCLKRLDKL